MDVDADIKELEALGVSADKIDAIRHKTKHLQQPPSFDVLPENIDVINWFLEHQIGIWMTGMNGIESLNYSQIQALFNIEQTKNTKPLFKKLLVIERAYINTIRA